MVLCICPNEGKRDKGEGGKVGERVGGMRKKGTLSRDKFFSTEALLRPKMLKH